MSEQPFSLFGMPSPAEVRQSIGRAGMQDDIALASMPAGSGGKLLGAQAGRLFGNAIQGAMGVEDPRVQRAQRMEQAKQRVAQMAKQSGIDFGKHPDKYMDLTAGVFADMGEQEMAFKVLQAKEDMMASRADSYYKTAAADADLTNADTKAKMAQYQVDDIISKINTREGTLKLQAMRNGIMAAANQMRQGGNTKSAKEAEMIGYAIPILDSLAKEKRLPTPQEKAILTYAASRTSPTMNSAIGEDMVFGNDAEIDPNAGVQPNDGAIDFDSLP